MKFFSAALIFSVLIYEVYTFQSHDGLGKFAPKRLGDLGKFKSQGQLPNGRSKRTIQEFETTTGKFEPESSHGGPPPPSSSGNKKCSSHISKLADLLATIVELKEKLMKAHQDKECKGGGGYYDYYYNYYYG